MSQAIAIRPIFAALTKPSILLNTLHLNTPVTYHLAASSVRHASARTNNTRGPGRSRMTEQASQEARAMEKNFTRDWKAGDVYAPHDLSAAEARKWKKRESPRTDAFDALSLNPHDLYKNFSVMSEYVSEMGRIRPGKQTGLRPVNQRRIARAIRRAIALGLMPSVHRHPEILRYNMRRTLDV